VTIGLTIWKFLHDAAIAFSVLYPAVAIVILAYFLVLAGFAMTHRLEQLAEIVDAAL
jgi:hypothetical protein